MDFFNQIFEKPFIKKLVAYSGNVYAVGGCVRDHYLNLEPKDIDLVVQGIHHNVVVELLAGYGELDLVGESFGILKFKAHDGFEAEIALPRVDKIDKTKKGHRAILAQSNHELPIEVDLKRRDFTVNSIAIDHNLNIIDPFNGLLAIKYRMIKPTDPSTFLEDPLRILRAVQFASRFSFMLSNDCVDLIKSHVHLINEITPERIFMEFQKVIDKKGNIYQFLKLLKDLGIYKQIFGIEMGKIYDEDKVKSLGELLCLTVRELELTGDAYRWSYFFSHFLKIDSKTKKELIVFERLTRSPKNLTELQKKRLIFECLQTAPWLITSNFLAIEGVDIIPFINGEYPAGSYSDLKINGNELMALGFEGKGIKVVLNKILDEIFQDKLKNDKEQMLNFVKNGYESPRCGSNNSLQA